MVPKIDPSPGLGALMRRIAWFVGLWAGGVGAMTAVGWILKALMRAAGMH